MQINWTLGTDPEVFLIDNNGEFKSAYDGFGAAVKGTKEKPEPTSYGAIQIDGMAVEFNTNPTDDVDTFSHLIEEGLADILDRYRGHHLSQRSVFHFNKDWMANQPEKAVEMGCDPDFDPYCDGDAFAAPNQLAPMRTAGGHLHIGWTDGVSPFGHAHYSQCIQAARQLDCVLGLWSLSADAEGAERRALYGKAGAFRPKPYGLEYRVLSNFWVFDEDTRKQVARRAVAAMDMLVEGKVIEEIVGLQGIQLMSIQGVQLQKHPAIKTIEDLVNKYVEKRHVA